MMFLERLRSLPLRTKLLPGLALVGVASIGLLGNSCQRGSAWVPYTDEQIESYARSIIEIEPLRVETSDRLQELTGSQSLPPIVCTEQDNLQSFSSEAREVTASFCDRSREIARANDLTVADFNGITRELGEDPALKERVEQYVKDILEPEDSPSQNVLDSE